MGIPDLDDFLSPFGDFCSFPGAVFALSPTPPPFVVPCAVTGNARRVVPAKVDDGSWMGLGFAGAERGARGGGTV